MKCPKCKSKNTIANTDKELRVLHLLVWQCFDCEEEWITGWDIAMPPRSDIIEHIKKYENEIKNYILIGTA